MTLAIIIGFCIGAGIAIYQEIQKYPIANVTFKKAIADCLKEGDDA